MFKYPQEVRDYVHKKYSEHFGCNASDEYNRFINFFDSYQSMNSFKIDGNVFDDENGMCDEEHFIMRCVAQYYMEHVFRAMKIDLTDPNVAGEKGTPYRVVKMWTGADLDDDRELMSGRWMRPVRIASFPNTHEQHIPITKRVPVISVCSHHLAPFSTLFDKESFAVISYIPKDKVLGISKLSRLVTRVALRGHLQEELTRKIYQEISNIAETESVYVKLFGLKHTCELLRGSKSEGDFTSEYYGGAFQDPEIRKQSLANY